MAQSEKMKQTLDKLEAGVMEFFTSEKYITYLQVMSKFHTYSANNQVLIAMQMPDATAVAGYNSWIRNFDRHVKKGEKSITILAPMKLRLRSIRIGRCERKCNTRGKRNHQIPSGFCV